MSSTPAAVNYRAIAGEITQDHGSTVEIVVLALTAFSLASTVALLVARLFCKFFIPVSWRIALAMQDVAYVFLASGLAFFLGHVASGTGDLCSAAGFFLLLGLLDAACMLVLAVVALLFFQSPAKLGQLSTFRRSKMALLVLPEKLAVVLLALIPVTPVEYFDTRSPYPVACFPVRQEGGKGAAFGAILFFILWVLQILGLTLSGICAFRLWKSSGARIHASCPNLWQAEKLSQGRGLQKMLLLEQVILLAATFALTVVVYTNASTSSPSSTPSSSSSSWLLAPQWVVMVILAVMTSVHGALCGLQLLLWSERCCCQVGGQRNKEPYQRLKKLELIKVEGPGKLRLRASWSAGRGLGRKGLVKVYGLNQLKGWAQEIVVLGMLRKSQSPSLLQCLWTANTNPYFETMTVLSGQIVTSESRLICLELTSSGSLQDLLGSLEVPLPESCTRTILHDLAEGLAALHAQNILHRNLTSAAVYLKGSVQRLLLRAAVGDFEEAQIYGSLQNGALVSSSSSSSPSSATSAVVSKKHFFLPDIRAFALVALEILGVVCKRRLEEKQPHRLITTARSRSQTEGVNVDDTDPGRPATHGHIGPKADGAQVKVDSVQSYSHRKGPAPRHPSQLAAEATGGGKIFVVATSTEALLDEEEKRDLQHMGWKRDRKERGSREDLFEEREGDFRPPSLLHSDSGDSGASSLSDSEQAGREDYYFQGSEHHPHHQRSHRRLRHHRPGRGGKAEEGGAAEEGLQHPSITHVQEAYRFEFPNQSVFRVQEEGAGDAYEEIDDIEEEIHREIRYNALNRRRLTQTGGYIVTRTTSGRELFLPHNMNVLPHHPSHNSSYANSDSGYVGTSSTASSRYPYSPAGDGVGVGVEDPPDATPFWPKAAHRTTSAQTISSFGDDVLEVLPGMADEPDAPGEPGPRSLRQILRARGEAKVEQILTDYERRVRAGGLAPGDKPWPKLRFSRTMQEAKGGSRPSTPRAASASTPRGQHQKEEGVSPRPKNTTTAGPSPTDGGAGAVAAKTEKARPLSATSTSVSGGAWKLRTSFKKSKARNELVRVLSKKNAAAARPLAAASRGLRQHTKGVERDQRGGRGKLVERKYAEHNAAAASRPNEGRGDEKVEERDDDEEEQDEGEIEMVDESDCRGTSHSDRGEEVVPSGREVEVAVARRSQSLDQVLPASETALNAGDKDPSFMQGQKTIHGQVHYHHQFETHSNNDNNVQLGKFTSFGSNDSVLSYDHPHQHCQQDRDVSLTSGELTSLSSQADSRKDRPNPQVQSKVVVPDARGDDKIHAAPVLKIVDSGFDEDSVSVVSDISYEAEAVDPTVSPQHESSANCTCSCSCGSETVTGSGSCSCTCTCSECHYGHSPASPGRRWESVEEEESSVGTWSNSNSFSSYDVQMHRRKLPSGKRGNEELVLGPDEQYPSSHKPRLPAGGEHTLMPAARHRHHRCHHHHRHHHNCSHSHTCSSSSASSRSKGSSSVASRRYRELTKKGVPLRVSRVDEVHSPRNGGGSSGDLRDRLSLGKLSRKSVAGAEDAEVIEEEEDALYQDLASKGFFDSTDSASSKSSPLRQDQGSAKGRRLAVIQVSGGRPVSASSAYRKHVLGHFPDLPSIPSLEDLIREIPDETGPALQGAAEAKAFLNRPESELSVRALKPPAPPPPAEREPYRAGRTDEDKVFSRHHDHHQQLAGRGWAAASRDGVTLVGEESQAAGQEGLRWKEAALLVSKDQLRDLSQMDAQGPTLLRGTDSKHVRYVQTLGDKVGVQLLHADDLLPADARSFETLKRRLEHTGNLGTIAQQLLDIVGACWVKEAPPSTADIVDQLTDHVTETEL